MSNEIITLVKDTSLALASSPFTRLFGQAKSL